MLGLVGCGGGGGTGSVEADPSTEAPEPPAYYGELAALTAGLDEANTAADGELHDAMATTDPANLGDLFSVVTAESADRLEDVLAQMDRLSPPPDAVSAHEELVAASRAELALSRRVAEAFAGLDQAGVEAYQPPPDQADIEARVDGACLDVQAIAEAAGADVDLCVGMFAEPGLG